MSASDKLMLLSTIYLVVWIPKELSVLMSILFMIFAVVALWTEKADEREE